MITYRSLKLLFVKRLTTFWTSQNCTVSGKKKIGWDREEDWNNQAKIKSILHFGLK
jgi:hypothetical protein